MIHSRSIQPADTRYANISRLAQRWRVDRTSVPKILQGFEVPQSALHRSPRYQWIDILTKVEGIKTAGQLSAAQLFNFLEEPLLTTNEVADLLGVTTQTVRNYVIAGKLPMLRLAPQTPRFHRFCLCENAYEATFGELSKG